MTLLAMTSLLAALITAAIAISIIVRTRRTKVQLLFAYFNANLAFCFVGTFFVSFGEEAFKLGLGRGLLIFSLLLPIFGIHFFSEFLSDLEKSFSRVLRVVYFISVGLSIAALSPLYNYRLFIWSAIFYIILVFLYIFIATALRYKESHSTAERSRLKPIFYGGFAALGLIGLDIISFHFDWPYIFLSNLFLAMYMYYILQMVLTARALDMSEILGRGVVLGVLSFIIAGLYWLMTFWTDTAKVGTFFFSVLVASIVILILYEPLKNEVEGRIAEFFFRRQRELQLILEELRRDLVHVVDVRQAVRLMMERLRSSRRFTHASFYLLSEDGRGFELIQSFGRGEELPQFMEIARYTSFFQYLERERGPLIKQEIEFRYTSTLWKWRSQGEGVLEEERLIDILHTFNQLQSDISLPCFSSHNQLLGFLNIRDERFDMPYSSEELSFMMMVTAQLSITIENSRFFEKIKERERLAALGEIAAGLAHEIRNPLGAMKTAAQLLNPEHFDENDRELIGIILEEVDRLNSVVSQFLDYARPLRNNFSLIDLNQLLQRTVYLLETETMMERVKVELDLAPDLPLIDADPEQLKQVFINLIRNSAEAMPDGGTLTIETRFLSDQDEPEVEIVFADQGHGIPPDKMKNIFIPFYTTKENGTGLGLSICQRIIEHHSGTITVQSEEGKGTQFIIRLPIQQPRESSSSE